MYNYYEKVFFLNIHDREPNEKEHHCYITQLTRSEGDNLGSIITESSFVNKVTKMMSMIKNETKKNCTAK